MYGLPNGTIFQEMNDSGTVPSSGLFIKHENRCHTRTNEPHDFYRTPLFLLELPKGHTMFAPSCYCGKLNDDKRKYLVLETQDVSALRGLLGAAYADR